MLFSKGQFDKRGTPQICYLLSTNFQEISLDGFCCCKNCWKVIALRVVGCNFCQGYLAINIFIINITWGLKMLSLVIIGRMITNMWQNCLRSGTKGECIKYYVFSCWQNCEQDGNSNCHYCGYLDLTVASPCLFSSMHSTNCALIPHCNRNDNFS